MKGLSYRNPFSEVSADQNSKGTSGRRTVASHVIFTPELTSLRPLFWRARPSNNQTENAGALRGTIRIFAVRNTSDQIRDFLSDGDE